MSEETTLKHAFFTTVPESGAPIQVHFNPASLELTIANTLDKGRGDRAKQYVSQSTAKLTMDLVFDTTDRGTDVRADTEKIALLMKPRPEGNKKVPSIVKFEWGTFVFQGMVESYKETLDFFAPNGVPLRSSVNLTLAQQDFVFEPSDTSGSFDTQGSQSAPVEVPGGGGPGPGAGGPGGDAASTAAAAGDPRSARTIGAANGQESLRFAGGGPLVVAENVSLGRPAAFATGGAGGGLTLGGGLSAGATGGAGASAGLSVGAGIGGAGGVGIGVQASGGAAIAGAVSRGGRASAGVSVSEGAFAGLRTSSRQVRRTATLDVQRLLPRPASTGFSTDAGATFGIGGQANFQASASLSADVGATASLNSRIKFEE